MREIVDLGVEINARDHKGRTALHVAAQTGNAAMTVSLLEAGAAPGARDGNGYTPLRLAEAAAALAQVTLILTVSLTLTSTVTLTLTLALYAGRSRPA